MTQPNDDFDLDAFDAAFAKEFGEPLADEPDDDAPPGEPEQPQAATLIAMVLTPVADASVLAKLMGLVKIDWPVLPTRTGAITATTVEIDEMAQLTGTPPEGVTRVAQALSQTSEFGVVLLTSQVRQGQEGATGQIQAWRYVGGAQVEELSAGVVLAGADETVEKVIFGQAEPHELPGVLDPLEEAQREDDDGEPPAKRRWGRRSR